MGGGGGGGYSTDAWVGRCGPGVETLTLFKTQFSDFTIPFRTECEIAHCILVIILVLGAVNKIKKQSHSIVMQNIRN